tara:strand:+ start:238 stop:462 length:225 start_codon:yes stop_codon:yes gene_type:complete
LVITEAQRESFEKAVNSPENVQSNGHINWNFVDADFYMDLKPENDAEHYAVFEQLATDFEAINGVQTQEKTYAS